MPTAFPPQVVIPPPNGRRAAGGEVVRFGGEALGTRWSVAVTSTEPNAPRALQARCERAFDLVVRQMSQWEPASELSRFNESAAGSVHAISPQFAHVLAAALDLATASGGAFDPALGAASDAWGFGAVPGVATPGGRWRELALDAATGSLRQPGGVRLDLSGIAKGYAVDLLSQVCGDAPHLVEIGGELRGLGGKADGQPWWVELARVPGSEAAPVRIALSGWSVATSGDWERRRSDGRRSWSHTLAPATGTPIECLRAATVLHPGCLQADGIATVMMVLGAAKGLAWADSRGLAVRLTDLEGGVHESRSWRRFAQ